ncbi:zf-HC2 domain-containing protein [Clostridium sp. HBUAS56010]|uniref:zf-HC2 domain-containing protein n=1 Tax=Clostridium sp. HBUAS56010 TaxID=2571127 RepID=UPI00117777C4|nr:zf-HC2 domain-containing protein [Clostridium sp. HBUAS56010]
MKNTLDCNIVRDMLPLYAEKLTSEESNTAIRQHLEQCEDCSKYLVNIQKPIDCPTVPKMEIDYMRKVKNSFKRRAYILSGVIAVFCIILLGIFLRLFIIGTPIFIGDAPINYEWNYDTDSKVYSIHGTIEGANTSARIKIYKDKNNNQIKIKIYEIMPSIFFSSNQFSVKIPWNGEADIVWQGKDSQQVITSSQYLNLSISEFQNGHYQNIMDLYDVNGASLIKDLYDKATEVSSNDLVAFDEAKFNQYFIISFPLTAGGYSGWITEDKSSQEQEVDERVFLYQEDGQYYFYKQGQHLKKLSTEDMNKISDYMKTKEVSQ